MNVDCFLSLAMFMQSCISFSKQLRKEYGANVLPAFPPKKLFSLTPAEVEQRREQLEKYMQAGEWLEGSEADSVKDYGERIKTADSVEGPAGKPLF